MNDSLTVAFLRLWLALITGGLYSANYRFELTFYLQSEASY